MSDSNPGDHSAHQSPRNPGILPTDQERRLEEERQKAAAQKEADNTREERAIKASEKANDLAESNRNLQAAVLIFTAVTAGATIFQGWLNHNSWKTAQGTLQQMQTDAKSSSSQFRVQLQHFDAGLGKSDQLAGHVEEQAKAANAGNAIAEVANRPWVGDRGIQILRHSDGAMAGVIVMLINGGRNPAIRVNDNELHLKIGEPLPTFGDPLKIPVITRCKDKRPNLGDDLMINGAPLYKTISVEDDGVTKDQIRDVLIDKKGLYIVGCVDYSDPRGGHYRTYVSQKYVRGVNTFSVTKKGNGAY